MSTTEYVNAGVCRLRKCRSADQVDAVVAQRVSAAGAAGLAGAGIARARARGLCRSGRLGRLADVYNYNDQ